jgi:hypothetical protein
MEKNTTQVCHITVVGIDLGSSKTKVAAITNGVVDIVTN